MAIDSSSSSTSRASDSLAEYQASLQRAQKFAQEEIDKKVTESQNHVREIERQEEESIKALREKFAKQYEHINDYQEEVLESKRITGQQRLHEVEKQQDKDLFKATQRGDKDATALDRYYQNKMRTVERDGANHLHETIVNTENIQRNEQNRSDALLADHRMNQEKRLEALNRNADLAYQNAQTEKTREMEQMQTKAMQAVQRKNEEFNAQYKSLVDSYQYSADNLTNKATQEIDKIRENMTRRLGAYQSKESDPFYQIVDMNIQARDVGDAYIFSLNVPNYEAEHISTNLQGDKLIITGTRHGKEARQTEAGGSKGTETFQSFHETFVLPSPVDGKKIARESKDGHITITVPKKKPPHIPI